MDAVRLQHANELVDRASRMSDREDRHPHIVRTARYTKPYREVVVRLRTPLLLLLGALTALCQQVNVQEHILDNGMRFLLVPRKGSYNVAAGWVARVGSVNERPGITGISHLFEHMMFKGTNTIGTKDSEEDAKLNMEQDRVKAELAKEEQDLARRHRLGEIDDPKDPKNRTPRHQELLAQFDKILKRQA